MYRRRVPQTGNPKCLGAVYYRLPDGRGPVSDCIDALPVNRWVVLDIQIDRIDEGARIVVATGSSAPQSALTGTAQIFSVNAFVSYPV